MPELTFTDRQVRAIHTLVGQCSVDRGTKIPAGDGSYVEGKELWDLMRRLEDYVNPLDPIEPAEVTVDVVPA